MFKPRPDVGNYRDSLRPFNDLIEKRCPEQKRVLRPKGDGLSSSEIEPTQTQIVEEPMPPVYHSPTMTGDTQEEGSSSELALSESGDSLDNIVIVELPSSDLVCKVCGVRPGKITQVARHYATQHKKFLVKYSCRKCGRSNENSHSISCHIPKCQGIIDREEVAQLDHRCSSCEASFATESGLSQHKRHVHPTERNLERIETVHAKRVKGGATALWSEEEIRELLRLSEVYAGERYIHASAWQNQCPGAGEIEKACEKPHKSNYNRRNARGDANATSSGGNRREAEGEGELSQFGGSGDWSRFNDGLDELIEKVSEGLKRKLGGGEARRERAGNAGGGAARVFKNSTERRSAVKRESYRRHQMMYAKDPAKLASEILDGMENAKCPIQLSEVHAVFKDGWERNVDFRGLGRFAATGGADNECFTEAISAETVKENLGQIKRNTAPGPDRITRQMLSDWDPSGEKLERLYTAWMVAGVVPKAFKECRTTLIPKSTSKEALEEVGNWRPITIGSLILRLFSKIMAERLARACPINPRQRGFISAPGCAENLKVLQGLIGHCKKERSQLAVVFVDFARAFDSISHEHILSALGQRQLDQHVIKLIQSAYVDCVTRIIMDGAKSPDILMKVGVKQGDSMSPILFNLAMDPLIQSLENLGSGYKIGGSSVTTLAFADDLVLLSSSWDGMRSNIALLDEFCERTGLRVQSRKCHGFLIRRGATSYTVNDCSPWDLGGEPIHLIEPHEVEKYLGVKVNPWVGITKPDLNSQLGEWVTRIGGAPLKPYQKVGLLNDFAIPRLIYLADHCDLKGVTLATLDGTIRRAVKGWLHLPLSTCGGLLYSRVQDGGLGILKLEALVPSIQARRLYRLLGSEDEIMNQIMTVMDGRSEFARMWCIAGGDPGAIPPVCAVQERETATQRKGPVPCDWRQEEKRAWCNLPVQGRWVEVFDKDRISSAWMRNPERAGFKQRHYIAALQLRANVYPTREALARGRTKVWAKCRRCAAPLESCSHILGQCPSVQSSRIKRHNKMCALLAQEAERYGWTVIREPRISGPLGELRLPDLVLSKGNSALVIDVTVRFEYEARSLEKAAEEKVAYYAPYESQIAALVGAERVQVFGFPVGARGKWPSCNNHVLSEIGLGPARAKYFGGLCGRRALLYSLDVLRDFGRPDHLQGR
uniref:ribonuclease H n=1 Tax=Astyanax mexicanus TaxID=7994 RepID=A0A3B1JJF5_ASTMX